MVGRGDADQGHGSPIDIQRPQIDRAMLGHDDTRVMGRQGRRRVEARHDAADASAFRTGAKGDDRQAAGRQMRAADEVGPAAALWRQAGDMNGPAMRASSPSPLQSKTLTPGRNAPSKVAERNGSSRRDREAAAAKGSAAEAVTKIRGRDDMRRA